MSVKLLLTLKLGLIYIGLYFCSVHQSAAQVVLYDENFDNYPATWLNETGGSGNYEQIPAGSPPCVSSSIGTTADFNSTNIDFQSGQNATSFLGVNPESPCGGFYNTIVKSDTLDLSTLSNLKFKGRYIITNTLGWGASLNIILSTSSFDTTFSSPGDFEVTNNWADFEFDLSSKVMDDTVVMTIYFSAGDGIGLDDLELSDGVAVTSIEEAASDQISVYPIPTEGKLYISSENSYSELVKLYDITGNDVTNLVTFSKGELDITLLHPGNYFMKVTMVDGTSVTKRVIKM